jgi:hypothetical protein
LRESIEIVGELDRAATAIELAKRAAGVAAGNPSADEDLLGELNDKLQLIVLWSVRAAALASGHSPREILSICWKAFPSDEEWKRTRQRIIDEVLAEVDED